MRIRQWHKRRKCGLSPKTTMYRPPFQIFRMDWEFHKNDTDPKPSVPHGHSLDNEYRLSIWDGKVYKKQNGKLIYKGTVNKKELHRLFLSPKFQAFIQDARAAYEENCSMSPPPLHPPRVSANKIFNKMYLTRDSHCKNNTPEIFRVTLRWTKK